MDKSNDIVPGILEKIKKEYGIKVSESDALKNIRELAAKKEITYKDAQAASQEIGKILSEAYGDELTAEILPNGRMYYNIASRIVRPTMEQAYFDIADITELTQNALNEAAGIGLKAIRPALKPDRIEGIIDRLAEAEKFEDVAWMLQAPVSTFCQSIVDDAVQANAEFQHKAGMQPKIIRRTAGNCCEWCSRLAGTYSYPNVPKDVYRRHNNCNCTVEYDPGDGRRQNIYTKRYIDEEELERRKAVAGVDVTSRIREVAERSGQPQNILTEYIRTATPKRGAITYEAGYIEKTHTSEIKVAQWLHDNLGGNIVLLQENLGGAKKADYLWREKLWELKNVSSAKAADSAVRTAIKQISENPGGIIIYCTDNKIKFAELQRIVDARMKRSGKFQTDILMIMEDELIKALRYKNIEALR